MRFLHNSEISKTLYGDQEMNDEDDKKVYIVSPEETYTQKHIAKSLRAIAYAQLIQARSNLRSRRNVDEIINQLKDMEFELHEE